MNPVRVYYRDNAILIDTVPAPFVAGTLTAMMNGANIEIRRADSVFLFATIPWVSLAREDGTTFADPDAALDYLDGEFSKRRPTSDRIRLAIDISEPGQRVIPIQDPPVLLSSVRLIVNGLEYAAPDIAASGTAVEWLNSDFSLAPGDRVTLAYS